MTSGITTNFAPNPRPYRISDLKDKLMHPALTSSYDCWFFPPGSSGTSGTPATFVLNWATAKGAALTNEKREILSLSCSEASLPGSSLATHEITGDYTGVTQKHAYRRLYDDRADFTFYVDSEHYQIHFFESWISYIVGETITPTSTQPGLFNSDYNYRVNYPNDYRGSIIVNKYEKDYGRNTSINNLVPASKKYTQYTLFEAFPISINSMPVSYDSSDVLKCTVSFAFSRYVITKQDHSTFKIAGAVDSGGYMTVDIWDGSAITTTTMSKAQYNQLLLQGASFI
jgi:hypothetical protein